MATWLLLLGLCAFVHGRLPNRGLTFNGSRDGVRDVIPKQYIVMYADDDAGSVQAATRRLARHIQSAASTSGSSNLLITASATAAGSSIQPSALFSVRKTLDGSPVSVAAAAVAAGDTQDASISTEAAAVATAGRRKPGRMLGVVIQVKEGVDERQLVRIMESAPHVQAVLPDFYIRVEQEPCADPIQLSQGVTSNSAATSNLKWANCINPDSPNSNVKLVWTGRRCGSNIQQIEYTALRVVDASGAIQTYEAAGNVEQCVKVLNPKRSHTNKQLFGGCGQAPTVAPDLPTMVCRSSASAGSCVPQPVTAPEEGDKAITATITLATPVKCTSAETAETWSDTLTYTGGRCGPNQQLITWTKATLPDGCVLVPGVDPVLRNDVFGECGVPPGNSTAPLYSMQLCPDESSAVITPSQAKKPCVSIPINVQAAQQKAGTVLPRKQLVANEIVPFGVQRIEAATCAGVADISQQRQQQQQRQGQPVVVAVVDSGVYAEHPDLNYVGGISFTDNDAHSTKPSVDYFGHGTHVAGIIGAKNNGQGVVGVSPGVPIYSVKVLNSSGWGEASTTLQAVDWIVNEGSKLGIQVINLSLAAYIGSSYRKFFNHLCSIYAKASAAGMLAVASAGNSNDDLLGFVPAGCQHVAAVTGLDYRGTSASKSSSWVASSASEDDKARVINAPAEQIISTVPPNVDPSGYKLLGGTSMAAPHVAGVAANCIMSGACGAGTTGMEKLAIIQAAARERRRLSPSYGFKGDPVRPGASSKYYGYLVWAGKF